MKRSIRFATVILLAGLVQVSLGGPASAENTPWEFKKSSSTRTELSVGTVFSRQQYGGFIGFACAKDEPRSRFVASVSVVEDNMYPWGEYTVSWRVDTGSELKSVWLPNPKDRTMGLVLVGQGAYELAQKVAQAKNQIEIKTPRGVIVNDLDYAAKTIGRLLNHCRLQ